MTVAVDTLRATLLDEARADAARAWADGDRRIAAMHAEAEERGRALIEQARAEGIAAAAIVGRPEQAAAPPAGAGARARREARALRGALPAGEGSRSLAPRRSGLPRRCSSS